MTQLRNGVEFRWKDENGDTHLINSFRTDWKFQEGETLNFWLGLSRVVAVQSRLLHFEDFTDSVSHPTPCLEVTQIVYVQPVNWDPKELWWDKLDVVKN